MTNVGRLAIGAAVALALATPGAQTVRLRYLATAHQLGIVGYRDPVGAVSPDGAWLAYSEGRHLRAVRVAGGPIVEFPAGLGQIRHLSWRGSSAAVVAEDPVADRRWWLYDVSTRERTPLWPERSRLEGRTTAGDTVTTAPNDLRQLAWALDDRQVAAIVGRASSSELWTMAADGASARVVASGARLTLPAWSPRGTVACVANEQGRARLSWPCGERPWPTAPEIDVYGPLAFSPDGAAIFFASPNDRGTVDLWTADTRSGRATRLTAFDRDSYHPSTTRDGRVVFKVPHYRTFVADVPADGGETRALTTFQSETPSWDPTSTLVGITYGTWRRQVDDINYPDIAQEVGIVNVSGGPLPLDEPTTAVATSASEDQSMTWSPNRKWLVLHSHKEMSDDLWLIGADLKRGDRRLTFLGRGAETGWPRWSPDGRRIVFDAIDRRTGRGAIYVIGVDQETGETTDEAREVRLDAFDGDASHAEWLPDSETLLLHAVLSPGEHALLTVPQAGGRPTTFHRYASEHTAPGAGVSPDGRWATYAAPAPDGRYQIFRVPVAGGRPEQITFDPTHKSQPAHSPDGRRVAFTVWSYEAQFWMLDK
jgi:Tol biopolymer transport system component